MTDSVSFDGQTVTFTGSNGLSSTIIGDNLTGMTHVIIEGYSSIEENAFSDGTGVSSITIPASITNIDSYVLSNMFNLSSIIVVAGNTNYKDISGVLFNSSGEILIHYPAANTRTSYEIPAGVTSIDIHAFVFTPDLTSIIIPASVNSVGSW